MMINQKKLIIPLALVLALGLFGCSLTDRVGLSRSSPPAAVVVQEPTRTAWPTFTPEPMETPTPLPSNTPTATLTPPPTDTPVPTDTPMPTDTPVPPTNTPVKPTAPPPPPTDTPVPPTEAPKYQFSPEGFYHGEANAAIGRFYGHIKDRATGAMVNGFCIRATCGSYAVISYPSGPSGVASDWAPGWYDIVIPTPIDCNWTLQVVQYNCTGPGFDSQCTDFTPLSEVVGPLETNVAAGKTIIVADWLKNW